MTDVLPEIALLISDHLRQRDLACCVRVCKTWCALFLPLLFRRIVFTPARPYALLHRLNQYADPTQCSTFNKYGHLVRVLESRGIEIPDPRYLKPSLQVIRVGGCEKLIPGRLDCGYSKVFQPASMGRLMVLVENNPLIHTFRISSFYDTDALNQLISDRKILRHLPALKCLELRKGVVKRKSTLDEIVECASRLQQLHINFQEQVFEEDAEDIVEIDAQDRTMYELGTLLATCTGTLMNRMVERCPNLKRFAAIGPRPDNNMKAIQQLIQHHYSGYPSRLQHLTLSLRGEDSHEITVSPLAEFLEVCGHSSGLKSIELDSVPITKGIIHGLTTFHAKTLVEVRLKNCASDFSSHGVQELLGKCPNLRHLELEDVVLYMEDIVQSPWVCKGLQVLQLNIKGSWKMDSAFELSSYKMFKDLKQRVWNQIGEMINLQTLHVSTADDDTTRSMGCKHRREGGVVLCNTDNLTMQDGAVENICKLNRLSEVKTGSKCFLSAESEAYSLRSIRPGLRIGIPGVRGFRLQKG